jgi:hypothetical protein
MGYKRCSRGDACVHPKGPVLPISEFYKDRTRKSGLACACKACRSNYERQYYDTHRSEVSESHRRYREANRDKVRRQKQRWIEANREHVREKTRQWHILHPQKCHEWARKWQTANREKLRDRRRLWRVSNPERNNLYARASRANQRAKKAASEGHIAASDIAELYSGQKGRCWWCGCELGDSYHIDHRIAFTRGGPNTPNNIVLTCPTCNGKKYNKLPHEWNGRLL